MEDLEILDSEILDLEISDSETIAAAAAVMVKMEEAEDVDV